MTSDHGTILNALHLTSDRAVTAGEIADKHLAFELQVYGVDGIRTCKDETAYHLSFLAEAWTAQDPTMFSAYARWAAAVLESRQISKGRFAWNLRITEDVLAQHAKSGDRAKLRRFFAAALAELENPLVSNIHSYLEGDRPLDVMARQYLEALLRMDRGKARELIFQALENGSSMRHIYLQVFERTQYEIGRLWQTNALSVAQEHYCTAATQTIMAQLYERFAHVAPRGKTIVATCVSGELHDMGLRIVCDFLEMEGWETVYCGASTPAADIVAMLEAQNAAVLAISATMTFHVSCVKEIIQAVKASGVKTKIIVGGAPFRMSPDLWKYVGADAFAENAAAATQAVSRIAP